MKSIVIIGASGGIGLAIAQACLESYPDATLITTYHNNRPKLAHPSLHWHQLDITDENAISAFAQQIPKVDMLVNAVGFLHSQHHRPEKSLKQFDTSLFDLNIRLNTLPSILLAKHFEAALKATDNSFFIACSARVGSIKDNHIGGWLSYRTSKAALNMAIKTISIEWRIKLPKCCVLLFHPGTTDTALSKPFQKSLPKNQLHTPQTTAESLLKIIKNTQPRDTGQFLSFDGSEIEW
ncbi:SDR family NAD(P)-dependent oxidoreductase [Neptunomonas concharum]|uniref:SDR family NAD(P)-dependent oxidoreductase n=1 Tax=Neptunomonas concharum TaxID=1031538 RepID=A0A5P1R6F4_9GAMM|nr:SDR family NAD(P)-dependent oxidoreductase [Neptunomonas concharum]QEQ95258.1 SDR family NAD(P)-dependent oxidoreductase [Neptunomonas concharum]